MYETIFIVFLGIIFNIAFAYIFWRFFGRHSLAVSLAIIGSLIVIYTAALDRKGDVLQAELWGQYVHENDCKMVEFGPQSKIMKKNGSWIIDPQGKTVWDCNGVRLEINK